MTGKRIPKNQRDQIKAGLDPDSLVPEAHRGNPKYGHQKWSGVPENRAAMRAEKEAKRKAAQMPKAPLLTHSSGGGGHGKLIALGAAGGAAVGAGYLVHRSRQQPEKASAVGKNLINPFEEVVVFGKAYSVVKADGMPESTHVRSGSPKTHIGRHVGHGQKLGHFVNSKGGGGKKSGLERYTGKHASQRVGPFHGKHLNMHTKFGKAFMTHIPGQNLNRIKSAKTMMPKPPHSSTQPVRSIGALPTSTSLAPRPVSKGFDFGGLAGKVGRNLGGAKKAVPIAEKPYVPHVKGPAQTPSWAGGPQKRQLVR